MWRLKNLKCGGVIATTYWTMTLTSHETGQHLKPPEQETEIEPAMRQRLHWNLPREEDINTGDVDVRAPRGTQVTKPTKPKPWGEVREKGAEINAQWATIYEPSNPAPPWNKLTAGDKDFFGPHCFGIIDGVGEHGERIRKVTLQETFHILGLPVRDDSEVLEDEEATRQALNKVVAVETLSAVLYMVKRAITLEIEEKGQQQGPLPILTLASHKLRSAPDPRPSILSTYEVNKWTTIPIPSDKTWRDETERDPDLATLKKANDNNNHLDKKGLETERILPPVQGGQTGMG